MKKALLFLVCLVAFVSQVHAGDKGRKGEGRYYGHGSYDYDPVAALQADILGNFVFGPAGYHPRSYGYHEPYGRGYGYDPCYPRSRSVLGRVLERGVCREIDNRAYRRDRETDFRYDREAERAADAGYREGRETGYRQGTRDTQERSEKAQMKERIVRLEQQLAEQRTAPTQTPVQVIEWVCTQATEPSLANDRIKIKNMTGEIVHVTEQYKAVFTGGNTWFDLSDNDVVCLPGPITRYTFGYMVLTDTGKKACPVRPEVDPRHTMYVLTYSPQGGGCR